MTVHIYRLNCLKTSFEYHTVETLILGNLKYLMFGILKTTQKHELVCKTREIIKISDSSKNNDIYTNN